MDNVAEKCETYLRLRYEPVRGLNLDQAIKELKYISKKLGSFGLVRRSSRDVDAVRRMLAIIDGMIIPEKIMIDGEA
jgi:hypothetical protein